MRRTKETGTLRRFVARAISDDLFINNNRKRYRPLPSLCRKLAETAIAAVKRGKARGLR